MTNNTIISRNTDILANSIGSETVMMSIQEGKYYGTNKTGSYIWQLLESPLTFEELCERLSSDYSISRDKCKDEIIPFIEDLLKENIILAK